MHLKKFTFHMKPDVRLVVLKNTVFKIKLTCQHSERNSIKSLCGSDEVQDEIERVICGVLYHEKSQPIITDNFTIYPYKKKWPTSERLAFKYRGDQLEVNHNMFIFYVEPRIYKKNSTDRAIDVSEIRQKQKRKISNDIEEARISKKHHQDDQTPQRIVTDYGQKNRYDIETQNLTEQLRMQEMAQPSQSGVEEESGLIETIRRLFRRSK